VRKAAGQLLGQIGPKARGAALAALLARQGDADAAVRQAMQDALAKLGQPTEDDIKALTVVARDGGLDPGPRIAALRGLAALEGQMPDLLPLLKDLLKDPSKDLRAASVAALGKVAEKQRAAVVPSLMAALSDGEDSVRAAAQAALTALGPPNEKETADLLKAFKSDKTPTPTRLALAALLGQVGPDGRTDTTPALLEGLAHKDKAVRDACAAALDAYGPPPLTDVPQMVQQLNDADSSPELKRYLVRAFAKLGPQIDRAKFPQVSRSLFDLLTGGDAELSDAAFQALSALGPPRDDDAPALVKLLQDKKAVLKARVYAVGGLAALRDVPDASKAVLAALADGEADIRRAAAQALGRPGVKSKEMLDGLVKALQDADPGVRNAAAAGLTTLPADSKPLPYLLKAFEADDDAVVRKAAEGLARLGAPTKADVPTLKDGLKSARARTRLYCTMSLAELGPDALPALDALGAALRDVDPTMRQLALRAVRGVGPEAKSVAANVTTLLKEANPRLKLEAALTLAALKLEGKDVAQALFEAAVDKENPGMEEAAAALKKLGDWAAPAVPYLIGKLDNEEMRPLAVPALASIGKPAVKDLIEVLKDKDAGKRQAGVEALGQMGPPASQALGLILTLAQKDPVPEVKAAARKAADAIQKKP
jgi:HEAT repeat protein